MRTKTILLIALSITLVCLAGFTARNWKTPTLKPEYSFTLQTPTESLGLAWTGEKWIGETYNGKALTNHLTHPNRIDHLIDLLKRIQEFQPKEMEKLDFKEEDFFLHISFQKDGKTNSFRFYKLLDRTLGVQWIEKGLQKRTADVEVLDYLQNYALRDLLNRKLFSFALDDVEDFTTSGNCPKITLARDGDQWIVRQHPKNLNSDAAVEDWLKPILELNYDRELSAENSAPSAIQKTTPCTIELSGRLGKKEKVQLFSTGTALSSTLNSPVEFSVQKIRF